MPMSALTCKHCDGISTESMHRGACGPTNVRQGRLGSIARASVIFRMARSRVLACWELYDFIVTDGGYIRRYPNDAAAAPLDGWRN